MSVTGAIYKEKLKLFVSKYKSRMSVSSTVYIWSLFDDGDHWREQVDVIINLMGDDIDRSMEAWVYLNHNDLNKWLECGDEPNQLSNQQYAWLNEYFNEASNVMPCIADARLKNTFGYFDIKVEHPEHEVLNDPHLSEIFIDFHDFVRRLNRSYPSVCPSELLTLASINVNEQSITDIRSPTETIEFIKQIHTFMFKSDEVFQKNYTYHTDKDKNYQRKISITDDKNIDKVIREFLKPSATNSNIFVHPYLSKLKLSRTAIRTLIDAAKPDEGIPNRPPNTK